MTFNFSESQLEVNAFPRNSSSHWCTHQVIECFLLPVACSVIIKLGLISNLPSLYFPVQSCSMYAMLVLIPHGRVRCTILELHNRKFVFSIAPQRKLVSKMCGKWDHPSYPCVPLSSLQWKTWDICVCLRPQCTTMLKSQMKFFSPTLNHFSLFKLLTTLSVNKRRPFCSSHPPKRLFLLVINIQESTTLEALISLPFSAFFWMVWSGTFSKEKRLSFSCNTAVGKA